MSDTSGKDGKKPAPTKSRQDDKIEQPMLVDRDTGEMEPLLNRRQLVLLALRDLGVGTILGGFLLGSNSNGNKINAEIIEDACTQALADVNAARKENPNMSTEDIIKMHGERLTDHLQQTQGQERSSEVLGVLNKKGMTIGVLLAAVVTMIRTGTHERLRPPASGKKFADSIIEGATTREGRS